MTTAALVLSRAPAAMGADAPTPADERASAPVVVRPETVDVAHLRDGTTVRGHMTEVVPDDHVSLVVDGEEKRIPWSDLDHVSFGSSAATPPVAAETPAPPMVGPRVRVHIRSSARVFLHRRPAGSADFVVACESPCDLELPTGDTYKIGGTGITTTGEFRIGSKGRAVEIDVNGPSWLGIVGGGLATIVGGLMAYGGLLVAMSSTSSNSRSDSTLGVGLGVMGVGGALLAVGLLIVFPSMKTDLSQRTLGSASGSKDAFLRTSPWRSPAIETQWPGLSSLSFERRF